MWVSTSTKDCGSPPFSTLSSSFSRSTVTGSGSARHTRSRRWTPSMPEGRFRHGLIVGKFYPLHVGHSHLIRSALAQCDNVTVELLGASVESIPLEVRADWIRREHPQATLVSALDDAPVDFESAVAWDEHMAVIEDLLDTPVD